MVQYNQYNLMQPYNLSETLIQLLRDCIIRYFKSCKPPIKSFLINLYTIEGLSKYYSQLNNNNNILDRPYLSVTVNDTPRLAEEITNVNIHTARLFPSISSRLSMRYFMQDPHMAPVMLNTKSCKISRIDQKMTMTLSLIIVTESYEMAYDIMRFCQATMIHDRYVTFRNLIALYLFSADNISEMPQHIVDELSNVSLYTITNTNNQQVFAVPTETWILVKATDYLIDNENVPYEGQIPTYKLTITWSLIYPEPVTYIAIY